MPAIERLTALEILDSRGSPTIKATCVLTSGARGSVSIPSGASTGAAEALELRDGDGRRYRGRGCRKAVQHIENDLQRRLRGVAFGSQAEFDLAMLALDGTPNKSRLGANAILAVSLAFARAVATHEGKALYQYFADLLDAKAQHLPRLTINLFSGGKHAGLQVPIQDVLIVPATSTTIDTALQVAYDVYQSAAELVNQKYGMRALRADEGGLAPPFPNAETMIEDAVTSIRQAGYEAGKEVSLAIDVASSHFYSDGCYKLGDKKLSSDEMIERLSGWLEQYPVVSLEDGLAEEDWTNWPRLCQRVGTRALVMGDDLLCTNPARIQRAAELKACSALLLKVNQIGTVTEAAEAWRLASKACWQVTVSARSGETEDDWLADLAVGWSAGQIKVGSITQSERLAKYNRLLEIESETHLPIVRWPSA